MSTPNGRPGHTVGSYLGRPGKVGHSYPASEPYWPPRPTPPRDAPNVVVMLADDLGFSDLGCYGSEIPTPNLDRISAEGLRYTNFHVTPLCSPTRAALMTGRNAHAAGVGMVSNVDPGFPGYTSELPASQPTIAEMLRGHGYSTLMVGKWHLCKDSDLSESGDRNSWPLQRGFDQFYGFLEALTNYHHPHRLYEGNSVVHVDAYPDGYYMTDDFTARAERMIREVKAADPRKPFFLYYAHGAVHAPLHVKREDLLRHRGRYQQGWDRLREERLARQVELGIMREGTRLPERNFENGLDVVAWDSLAEQEQSLFARYMEAYAAMVDTIDQSVGRLRATLEELGEWDNTIFLFLSDNGASREGFDKGSTCYWRKTAVGTTSEVTAEDLAALAEDRVGGPTTWPHYPRGWAMACNTPFRLYKITTFRGGHQVPLVVSWPRHVTEPGAIVDPQYFHVTDVLPTIAELVGIPVPDSRNGLPAEPLAGVSFARTLSDPSAPSGHLAQYFECNGNRGIYYDGWEALTLREVRAPNQSSPDRDDLVPLSEDRWHLFNVEDDPTQCVDLAEAQPAVLARLQKLFDEEAWANQVYPINEGTGLIHLWRPPGEESLYEPVTLNRATPTLERYRSSRLLAGRSLAIEAAVTMGPGAEGILVAHGGQESGYVLYVESGALWFAQNACGVMRHLGPVPLAGGDTVVRVEIDAPGNRTWSVRLVVDGTVRASGDGFMQFTFFLPFEGIDIGICRRSPVSWELYEAHGPFPFTGDIAYVRYEPGPRSADAREQLIQQALEFGLALE